MGMTMTQKILAAHAGLDSVTAGQLIEANLDLVLANDITGPVAIHEVEKLNKKTVFDKDKIALVPDHFAPNKDIKSAENSKAIREFAKAQGLSWYFEQGKSGVEHAILPEAGVVAAGECIIGADSPIARNSENDVPGFHVNTILKKSNTCAIKYGTGTTSHAAPANGNVPVIRYSNIPLVIWSNKTAPKIIDKITVVFFICVFPI